MKLRAGEWIVLGGSASIATFAALVGVLIYKRPPPVEFAYEETAMTRQGESVYRREGCSACHQIYGNGASYGPSLDGEGSRRSADWIDAYLRSPRAGVSDRPYRLRMPAYAHLPEAEVASLVAYLQALRFADAAH